MTRSSCFKLRSVPSTSVSNSPVAVGRLLGQRAWCSFGAGTVDRDIKPAEAPDSLFDKVAHVVFVAHVRQSENGFGAEAAKLVFECLAFGLAAAGYNDRCAFFGKGKRRGTTDTGQSAGDEDDRSVHSRCPLKSATRILGRSRNDPVTPKI
jgi:hypothetical protein